MKRTAQPTSKSGNNHSSHRERSGAVQGHLTHNDARSKFLEMLAFCTKVYDFKDEEKERDEKIKRLDYIKKLTE